jgi:alkylated DNA repair dioxygenase AlkB
MDIGCATLDDILFQVEPNGEYSYIGIIHNVFQAHYLTFIREWLDSMDDFRYGKTSFNAIPRVQKWLQHEKKYFSKTWNDQHIYRWMSCEYDNTLTEIEKYIQKLTNTLDILKTPSLRIPIINSCLINKYRDGCDSIRAHRDNQTTFGDNPTVIGVSIGSEREIRFNRIIYNPEKMNSIKVDKTHMEEIKFTLPEGSLFIMAGAVQKYYSHEIPKSDCEKTRYSLTFREFIE